MSKKQYETRWEAEGRGLLVENADAVMHALTCGTCELQGQARVALALVNWTMAEFVALWLSAQPGESDYVK